MVAKSLISEMSRMVAVLCSSVISPCEMALFRGLHEVVEDHNYHILFHCIRSEAQDHPATIEDLLSYRPAGCIILRGAEGDAGEFAQRIVEEGIPVVSQGQVGDSVCVDDRAATRLAADYVIRKGHRSLGHLGGPPLSLSAKERTVGFIESLIEHDIPVSAAVIVNAGDTPAAGYAAASDLLLQSRPAPTALVCFNDMVAMGAYGAAHKLGLAIPGDLSVVGIDGTEFGELLGPPLTTVDVFPHDIGRRAAQLLIEAIEGRGGRTARCEWMAPRLIERASVRALQPPETRAPDGERGAGEAQTV
jgi:LacI family transcriptional regulator